METRVLVGIPHMGTFPYQTVGAMLNIVTQTKVPTQFAMLGLSLVYIAREEIVKTAIEQGFSHVFFLDSDMNPPANVITRLISHDKDIVSGMCFKRVPPFEPCFYKSVIEDENGTKLEMLTHWEDNSLVEIEGVGMACTLIRTEVFKKLLEKDDKIFLPKDNSGEDIGFCKRARAEGFRIFVDTSLDIGHVSSFESNSNHWRAYRDNRANDNKE